MQNNDQSLDNTTIFFTPREQTNINFKILTTPEQPIINNSEPPDIKLERQEAKEKAKQAKLTINY